MTTSTERAILLAAYQHTREQLRAINRQLYPNFAHLFWLTVSIGHIDIDCQCELLDADTLVVKHAEIGGADITDLAERLDLETLAYNQWHSDQRATA